MIRDIPGEGKRNKMPTGTTTRKRTTAKKTTAKRATVKKTTARRSPAVKKTTATKRATAVKSTATRRAPVQRGGEVDRKKLLALHKKTPGDFRAIGAAMGIAPGRARREYHLASTKPGDMVTGNDTKVGKAIVRMKGEGLPMPAIRARTGLRPLKIKELYEATTGEPWGRGRGVASADEDEEATPRRRRTTTKKTTAKRTTSKKTTARRGRRPRAEEGGSPKDNGESQPRTRRERREASQVTLKKIWSADTPAEKQAELLEGRTILVDRELSGRRRKPTPYVVKSVSKVANVKSGGRAVFFNDAEGKQHVIKLGDIKALRA